MSAGAAASLPGAAAALSEEGPAAGLRPLDAGGGDNIADFVGAFVGVAAAGASLLCSDAGGCASASITPTGCKKNSWPLCHL